MAEQELKTWPSFFQAILDGRKNFEVRYDDRGFQAGDTVLLREWDPDKQGPGLLPDQYTGRQIRAEIGYVLHAIPTSNSRLGAHFQPGHNLEGYVVFALLDITRVPTAEAAS